MTTRTHRVDLRLNDEELAMVSAEAMCEGSNKGVVIRRAIHRTYGTVRNREGPVPKQADTRVAHGIDTVNERSHSVATPSPIEIPHPKGCPPKGPTKSKKRTSRKRQAPEVDRPDDWKPNAKHAEMCKERGLHLDDFADAFRDGTDSKAKRYADWDAGFRTWIRNEAKWRAERGGKPPGEVEHDQRKAKPGKPRKGSMQALFDAAGEWEGPGALQKAPPPSTADRQAAEGKRSVARAQAQHEAIEEAAAKRTADAKLSAERNAAFLRCETDEERAAVLAGGAG